MTFYISGPITGIEDYKTNFKKAQEYLESERHDVINPANLDRIIPQIHKVSVTNILDIDINLLACADAIALLPGWNHSAGCKTELKYALAHNYPIMCL